MKQNSCQFACQLPLFQQCQCFTCYYCNLIKIIIAQSGQSTVYYQKQKSRSIKLQSLCLPLCLCLILLLLLLATFSTATTAAAAGKSFMSSQPHQHTPTMCERTHNNIKKSGRWHQPEPEMNQIPILVFGVLNMVHTNSVDSCC